MTTIAASAGGSAPQSPSIGAPSPASAPTGPSSVTRTTSSFPEGATGYPDRTRRSGIPVILRPPARA